MTANESPARQGRGGADELVPILWHEAESGRLNREIDEIAAFAPDLDFESGPGNGPVPHHGRWHGQLPVWPLERPEPVGLSTVVPAGLTVEIWYSAAYPMLPPALYPVDPEPLLVERSQHDWHVAPDGSLCLLQTLASWDPRWSIVELLRRACGWRVEYALMRSGLVKSMTLRSIVHDASRDHLVTEAAALASGLRSLDTTAEVAATSDAHAPDGQV
jgi:hypothetical protein